MLTGGVRAEDEMDVNDEMIVSEEQELDKTEGDESTLDVTEQTSVDTYLLFTKPVFEEKASIGKYTSLFIAAFFMCFLIAYERGNVKKNINTIFVTSH